jgi:hypothetical protein
MQLPRGTFRALKKGVSIQQLLLEMKSSGFSGYCNISGMKIPVSLVLKNGKVLLATYNDLTGEDAWKAVLSILEAEGEAELSDLTEAQIQLSIEFNARAVVRDGDIRLPQGSAVIPDKEKTVPKKKAEISSQRSPARRREPDTIVPGKKTDNLAAVESVSATKKPEPGQVSPAGASGSPDDYEDDDERLIYEDLKVFDEMDLESMSEKIRANCRIMVEKLNLEHLLERDDKN